MKQVCVIGVGLMLALGEAAAANAASYVDTVKAANPLAYFRLNSVGQGSEVNGWTANWQSGVTTGAGTPIASDPGNQAAVFNGSSGITTNVTGISSTASTLMAWINGPIPGGDEAIAGADRTTDRFSLLYQSSGVQGSNAQRVSWLYGGGSVQSGQLNIANGWHLIAGTFDSTAGVANLYIDGSLSGSSMYNVFDLGPHAAEFDIGRTDSSFCTGTGGTFCNGGPPPMNGSIDEVAVFNYALSASQVANIYAARDNADSPIGTVPEPASWAMMIVGFGMIGARMRYRHRKPVLRYI